MQRSIRHIQHHILWGILAILYIGILFTPTSVVTAQSTWPDHGDSSDAENEEAQQDIDRILAQPRYDWDEDEPWFDFSPYIERFIQWLLEFFPANDGGPGGGVDTSNGTGFVWLLTLLTVGVLIFVLISLFRGMSFGLVRDGSLDLRRVLDGDMEGLNSAEALTTAQTRADDGDLRNATRYLYLSTLLTLEEKGIFRYNKSLTNREYLKSVADQPAISGLLTDVVNVFDRVWYGFQPIDQTTFDQYKSRIKALQEGSSQAEEHLSKKMGETGERAQA